MSTRTVYKYIFENHKVIRVFLFAMPAFACIRAVQMQNGELCMWAEVDVSNPSEERRFCVVGTGHPIPKGFPSYCSTVQDGPFVWHVYEYNP